MDPPAILPDFRRPPLVEVALSLQFEPLPGLTTAHIGLLWQKFRKDLPLVEEHAPLPDVLEEKSPPGPPRVEVALNDRPPLPRVWFTDSSRSTLIQIQADRFIHNWRRADNSSEYPRYRRLREQFRREVGEFVQFLRQEGLSDLRVNQCEVTYVNHFRLGEPDLGRAGRVFANWNQLTSSAFLPEPEEVLVRWRFRMPGEESPRRLHVFAQPVWDPDGSRFWLMNLMARGAPMGEGIKGAFRFFDLGHEWIVRGFADLTTQAMHRHWERVDVGTD